ncbi:MAG TPA: type II toxin-antitoxin system death-on-curing family toxin [Nevskiaceae bacterium]|nr:type II toxin-antitoxin system death-on-curing family toxin [Nevskiaceae bacterium]
MIYYLDIEEILRLHFQVVEDFGGSHGVRDEGRLQSLVAAPKQSAFGQEQYVSMAEKAAVYFRNIVADHPFVDGNKRTAVTACGVFLMRNGWQLTCTPKALEDFAVRVATDHLDIPAIAAWLKTHSTH